jgi:hypothetical protein
MAGVITLSPKNRVARVEDRLDGVERAPADISEDNPQSTDRESTLRRSVPVHGHSIRLVADQALAHHAGG